jgi:hypothetical protein
MEKTAPLLARPGATKIAARAMATRDTADLAQWMETLSAAGLSAADFAIYRTIDGDLARGMSWLIETIEGDFGPLGRMSIRLAVLNGDSFGRGRTAPDAWMAIRLLKEGADVTISLTRQGGAPRQRGRLRRARRACGC